MIGNRVGISGKLDDDISVRDTAMVSPGKLADPTMKASPLVCDDKLGDDNFVLDTTLASPDKSTERNNARIGIGKLGGCFSVVDTALPPSGDPPDFGIKTRNQPDGHMAYEGGKKQNVRKKGMKAESSGDIREIHMARNEGWSLVIPTEINGVQCQTVIDTAAQVTVVSEKIFQDMTPQPWWWRK